MNKATAAANLPPTLAPRGLRKEQAAAYLGISPRAFDEMVHARQMPQAKRIGAARVWDRLQLDEAFAALPSGDDAPASSVWDRIA